MIQILGTAIGVLLTLGTGQLISHRKQVENRTNMRLIGISEQEVMDYTDGLNNISDDELEESLVIPKPPRPNPDSLFTMPPLQ